MFSEQFDSVVLIDGSDVRGANVIAHFDDVGGQLSHVVVITIEEDDEYETYLPTHSVMMLVKKLT